MGTIRKKICLDTYMSRRNGLVPYCPYDEEYTAPINVDAGVYNGNYGNFPCDFAFISSSASSEGGKIIISEEEVLRMVYLEVLRKYRFIQERMKIGIPIKLVGSNDTYYSGETCDPEITFLDNYVSQWTTKCDEHEKYDYRPFDISLFEMNSNGYYVYASDGDEEHDAIVSGSTNLLLIDDYEKVMEYDKEWDDWWENGFTMIPNPTHETWEEEFLDEEYAAPEFYKFCQDFEKYVLGLVNVPQSYNGEKLSGAKVPEVVFYLNFTEYIDWFDRNRKFVDSDEKLAKEWDRRGGDLFYEFLNTIRPKWIENTSHEWSLEDGESATTVYFTYVPPRIVCPLCLTNDTLEEWEYQPYEYSLVEVSGVNGTIHTITSAVPMTYICPESGQGSSLKPQFFEFAFYDESGITYITSACTTVESQLPTLFSEDVVYLSDNVYGRFTPFYDENGSATTQMFKCTYHTGWSKSPKTEVYYSGETYEYMTLDHITADGEYIPEYMPKKSFIGKTYYGMYDEVPPSVTTDCYQVVDVEVIKTEEDPEILVSDTKVETFNQFGMVLSSYTRWSAQTRTLYGWWECELVDPESTSALTCADGEIVAPGDDTKYQNTILLSNIPNIASSELDGDYFYFLIKYDNGATYEPYVAGETWITNGLWPDPEAIKTFFDFPFEIGEPMNVRTYDDGTIVYDMVTGYYATDDSDELGIFYVLGATSGMNIEETGIHYMDTYNNLYSVGKFVVDGVNKADVFYRSLDFDGALMTIYNDELKLERKILPSYVVGLEVGSQWTESAAVQTMLITRDGADTTQGGDRYKVSIGIDRGTAAAWENYFKLSECNTLEDLENYSNNTFNL